MEAPILRVVEQRHPMDCGVACLAMLCGVSYENALVALAEDEPNVCAKGIYEKHLRRAAHRLGYRITRRRQVDLDADTGILNVAAPRWKTTHLVVLKNGLVIDTDATIWDADVFVAAQRAKLGVLYVLDAI